MDGDGRDITPKANELTFRMTKKKQEGDKEITTEQSCTVETILDEQETAKYTIGNVFGCWEPDRIIQKMEKTTQKLMKRL